MSGCEMIRCLIIQSYLNCSICILWLYVVRTTTGRFSSTNQLHFPWHNHKNTLCEVFISELRICESRYKTRTRLTRRIVGIVSCSDILPLVNKWSQEMGYYTLSQKSESRHSEQPNLRSSRLIYETGQPKKTGERSREVFHKITRSHISI